MCYNRANERPSQGHCKAILWLGVCYTIMDCRSYNDGVQLTSLRILLSRDP